MGNGWRADKRWSDRFLPDIKAILGRALIAEPPVEEDAEHNTDLIVLRLDAVRIACRVRKYQYIARYGDQFTIRRARPNGAKTELSKIIEGWGDYLFYGFSDAEETGIERYVLGDLKAFRLWYVRRLYAGVKPGQRRENNDSSSNFLAFTVGEIPGFVVDSNWFPLAKRAVA